MLLFKNILIIVTGFSTHLRSCIKKEKKKKKKKAENNVKRICKMEKHYNQN